MDKVTLMRSVDSMCLVETERTEKEVWSWERKDLRSDLETCLISVRSFSNFWGVLAGLEEELKPGVVFPFNKIIIYYSIQNYCPLTKSKK